MPSVKFIEHDGTEHVVQAEIGQTVMQTAMRNLVPGIVADCGGAMNCATCHAYLDPAWADRLPPPARDEQDMIEAGCLYAEANSRLTCQIVVTPELDGAVFRLPVSQS